MDLYFDAGFLLVLDSAVIDHGKLARKGWFAVEIVFVCWFWRGTYFLDVVISWGFVSWLTVGSASAGIGLKDRDA